jgi:allantoicase
MPDVTAPHDFTMLPDLASRRLGGSVVYANDELFADKENLIRPESPTFQPDAFGHKGKIYDGWETRRRRETGGHDHAIVRLGAPGIVRGVVVDTAYFRGNYPPQISIEAVAAEGYPSPAELAALAWQPLVDQCDARGDTANLYRVSTRSRWTHLRLSIYPDGGVARFRAHGEVVPDPDFLTGSVDLAALENGGQIADCSDAFYASAANVLLPGRPSGMADGWENARRRDGGNDFLVIRLAATGVPRQLEIDTTYFVGNAPGSVRVLAADLQPGSVPGQPGPVSGDAWSELLPRTRLQPDTRHRFLVPGQRPATHIRVDIFPDGGLGRVRVHGEIVGAALAQLRERYRSLLPR